MNNFKMTLQYDNPLPRMDKNEKSVKTVSYKLEQVLTRLLGQPVILHAAVRTEPGVHASCQVCSFEADLPFSPEVLKKQMNQYLPMDIKVLSLLPVSGRFRADLGIRAYTYEYNVCTASVYDVFHSRYQAHFFPAPDLALMKQAASCLIGKHDFQSFSPVRKKKGTKKELLYLDFIQNKEQLFLSPYGKCVPSFHATAHCRHITGNRSGESVPLTVFFLFLKEMKLPEISVLLMDYF